MALTSCSEPAEVPRLSSTPGTVNNLPPSAFFSSSCTNLDCSFDASGSTDSDGGIVSYDWDFDGGNGSGLLSSYSFASDGSYTVILTVTDTDGATSSASQTLFVTSGNAPPSSAFSSNCPDLSCSFDASASSDDGTIVDYSWDFGDGNSGSGITPVHGYSVDGSYPVVLTVTDDQGASSSSSKSVSVSAGGGGNDSPNAVFSAACTDLSCDFDASASTDDVGIVAYDWDFGDNSSGDGVTIGHVYTSDGIYPVILTVTDGAGASSTSQQSVSVSSGNSPPAAGFNFNCIELTCDFDASVSLDNDGTIVTYAWDFGNGTNGTGMMPSHTYTQAASYSVLLTVTDDDGAQASTARSVSAVTTGQSLYVKNCQTCHGADGLGGTQSDKDIRGDDAQDISDAIAQEPEMFSLSTLTANEIQSIANYLATL